MVMIGRYGYDRWLRGCPRLADDIPVIDVSGMSLGTALFDSVDGERSVSGDVVLR